MVTRVPSDLKSICGKYDREADIQVLYLLQVLLAYLLTGRLMLTFTRCNESILAASRSVDASYADVLCVLNRIIGIMLGSGPGFSNTDDRFFVLLQRSLETCSLTAFQQLWERCPR